MLHPLSPRMRLISVPSMVTTEARTLTRWERFRVWVESLADRAEILYHYPRVQRTVTKPMSKVVIIGDRVYCHPAVIQQLREQIRNAPEA